MPEEEHKLAYMRVYENFARYLTGEHRIAALYYASLIINSILHPDRSYTPTFDEVLKQFHSINSLNLRPTDDRIF